MDFLQECKEDSIRLVLFATGNSPKSVHVPNGALYVPLVHERPETKWYISYQYFRE